MSAGICIMNQNAIAMAADSAVTIGGGIAIHNSVNKLFSLSRIEPIGAIIYSNANFMQTPVEIILKQYRSEIDSEKRYFDKLFDYVDDFIDFLIRQKDFLRLDINEESFVLDTAENLLNGLDGDIKNLYAQAVEDKKQELNAKEYEELYEKALQETEKFVDEFEQQKEFDKIEYIKANYEKSIRNYIRNRYDVFSEEQENRIFESCVKVVCKDFYRSGYVGIAFAGYGKKEIYPTMVHIHIAGVLEDKVKYKIVENVSISERNRQSITPLAQVDVMETFLYGLNNALLNYMADMIPVTLGNDIENLKEAYFVDGKKEVVKRELEVCTAHIVNQIINKAQSDFFQPIRNAIGGLPMDELGMLAETMVNLTSMRRRVAIDSNSRTVGGPIDVAIISKGDGFIWAKRKHYFESDMNPQYFSRNFGSGKGYGK